MSLRSALAEIQLDAVNAYDAITALQEKWASLDAYDKHTCAVTVTKVAAAQGAEVPDDIYAYAGEKLSSAFPRHMKNRLHATADDEAQAAYTRLAKVAGVMDPEDVVNILFTIDDNVGLLRKYGSAHPDPLFCVFGQEKVASHWSWNHGGDYVTEGMLLRLAGTPRRKELERMFSDEMVTEFYSDPVATFKKMSLNHQIIFAHLASQSGVTNDGGTAGV